MHQKTKGIRLLTTCPYFKELIYLNFHVAVQRVFPHIVSVNSVCMQDEIKKIKNNFQRVWNKLNQT